MSDQNTLKPIGSGSYSPTDVEFLLRPLAIETTDVEEKERLIQSGERHYSEMISLEKAPSAAHVGFFCRVLDQNAVRMAADVAKLADALDRQIPEGPIVLASFVRAGVPLGVLLARSLRRMGREAHHYGISIIRDRGIDRVALETIIGRHGAEGIVFVDGWTGKGAISGELQRSLAGDPRFPDEPRLVVLADPCGKAWLSASAEDWIIPSGILGATISGLVSRSIWPNDEGMHGCIFYDYLAASDKSRWFIEAIETADQRLDIQPTIEPWTGREAAALQQEALAVVHRLAEQNGINNLNRVKPGIAEATRAVLRRVPERVLVRDLLDPDVQLLVHLAERAGAPVEEAGEILAPYRAVTLIQKVT